MSQTMIERRERLENSIRIKPLKIMAIHLRYTRKRQIMKRMISCALIFLLVNTSALPQTKSKNKATNQQQGKTILTKQEANSASNTLTLNSSSAYSAKANTTNLSTWKNDYAISDPVLSTLRARASGANIQFNHSGIVGMPKRAYGFANGHLVLNSTGAVTSGTQTGSGSVGTGTSLATFGSVGAPMNVNGKSPYAGINMWGNAMNMTVTQPDSFVRLTPRKKQ